MDTMDTRQDVPPPGHPHAIAQGCRCPVLDNAHGRGAYVDPEHGPQYWITLDCPLHGDKKPS